MMLLPFDIVRSALKKHELVDEPFIPSSFSPSIFLQVSFAQPDAIQVELGNELTPSQAGSEPTIHFVDYSDESDEPKRYTVMLVDPDAPGRDDHKFGPWRHWVQSGLRVDVKPDTHILPPNSTSSSSNSDSASTVDDGQRSGFVAKSDEEPLSPYVGPAPGKGTGTHRYVFLLYEEQPEAESKVQKGTTIKANEKVDRRNFDVRTFADENKLKLVGVNFFTVPTGDQ